MKILSVIYEPEKTFMADNGQLYAYWRNGNREAEKTVGGVGRYMDLIGSEEDTIAHYENSVAKDLYEIFMDSYQGKDEWKLDEKYLTNLGE